MFCYSSKKKVKTSCNQRYNHKKRLEIAMKYAALSYDLPEMITHVTISLSFLKYQNGHYDSST